ncbi:hypothetical protein QFC22_005870 [Naganishia vaughanmartiniae]|uniref:Uncharacterized protein n=1 Tax=Naganishia vaughanmartiniae TaxID=1424756 RepID=A0ACC2WRV6_9TREE|nr:hypothetical protein QFC22_005870 [Naganishia vaughanmartiniae]
MDDLLQSDQGTYQGFEVDEHADVEQDAEMEMEPIESNAYFPGVGAATGETPLFGVSHVQYSPPGEVTAMQVTNNILVLAVSSGDKNSGVPRVVLIDLMRADEVMTVDIPRPIADKQQRQKQEIKINALFPDPSGRHLLATLSTGETYYLSIAAVLSSGTSSTPSSSQVAAAKPRLLKLRHSVTSVAYPPRTSSSGTTECLLGSPTGTISTLILPPGQAQDDLLSTLTLKSVPGLGGSKSVSGGAGDKVEKEHHLLCTLPGPASPITGLAYGYLKSPSSGGAKEAREKRGWVVATTPERKYEFFSAPLSGTTGVVVGGKNGWGEEMCKRYFRDPSTIQFQEIPVSDGHEIDPGGVGMLNSWTTSTATASKTTQGKGKDGKSGASGMVLKVEAAAWLTSAGIYYSPIPTSLPASPLQGETGTKNESSNGKIFMAPSLLGLRDTKQQQQQQQQQMTGGAARTGEQVLAIVLTEWHVLVLRRERVSAYSRATEELVWDERIPLSYGEQVAGITADPINHTFWIYSNRTLYEVVPHEEDRSVWRARLECGDFEGALKYAKNAKQRDLVKSRQADAFFDAQKYLQAAQTYAECSRSFEFVALRFVDADEKDGLRVYLAERLARLDKHELTQRMMIATWLTEIYLSKCNTLEDVIAAEAATSDVESLRTELMLTEEDLRNFMTTYKNNLDRKVIYDLIQSHGRTEVYLFFAGLLEDDSIVIDHWVTEEKWLQAIDVLSRQEDVELYYRFAPILMRHKPRETVDAWLRQQALDPRRLIPALLVDQQPRSDIISGSQATRYLSTIIHRGNTDSTVHNLLINFLATSQDPDDTPLLRYLASSGDDPLQEAPYYDLDYALRICKQRNQIQPCVYIYSKMGLYECSVDLALEKGDLELAKTNADKPEEDDELRAKLWLKIAKYVVEERKDVKGAIQLLEESPFLKIEDILPYFPPFTSLDSIKNEVCGALESYSVRIDSLRQEMQDATDSANQIKEDIKNLENRFVTVDRDEACSRCGKMLLIRQFYVFPCQHVFHADCLIALAKDYLPSATLRRIIYLQNEIIRLSKPFKQALAPTPRGLLSTTNNASSSNDTISITSRVDPPTQENLLLGGPKRLLAAGDRLRELIVPDVLASAISVIGSGGASSDGMSSKKKGLTAVDPRDQNKVEKLRGELDDLVAAGCPLCEGSVTTIDKPFVTARDDDGSWEI